MIESEALYHMAGVSATQPVPVCFAGDAGAQPPGLAGHRPGSGEAPPGAAGMLGAGCGGAPAVRRPLLLKYRRLHRHRPRCPARGAPPGLGAGRVGWARLLGPRRGRPFLPFLPFLLFLLPRDITAPLPLEQPRTAAARQHRLAPRTARFGSTGTDPPGSPHARGRARMGTRVCTGGRGHTGTCTGACMSTCTRVGVHGHMCTALHRGRDMCMHKCASRHKSALGCTDLHQGRNVWLCKCAPTPKSALRRVCACAHVQVCTLARTAAHTEFRAGRGRAAWGVWGCDFWSGQVHLCSHSERFLVAVGW